MTEKRTGKYFGTEIDEKWWKRFRKEKMLARGNGTFSYDETSVSFLRLLTKNPIVIELSDIVDLKTGTWHAGQWGGGKTILKILWEKDNQRLSSGFTFSAEDGGVEGVLSALVSKIKRKI